jgi:hypothetical protein
LFHINFLPDFTHVYFLPARVEVLPALVQGEPDLTAPNAVSELAVETNAVIASTEINFRICQGYRVGQRFSVQEK